jgi:tripartite-type tricarboxylate transporter receptor subunit TctC
MISRRRLLATIGSATVIAQVGDAHTQQFPEGRITIVVGFGAGGITDITSRMLAAKLEKLLNTTVIIENRGGGGGTLAINAAGRMPADGNTIVSFLSDGPFTATYQGKPINLADWAIIGGYMSQERVLFAAKTAPFKTVQEMMTYARTNHVTMSDGTFWSGRVMEAFAKKNSLQIAIVEQRSGHAASMEVLGGHVTMAETGTGTPAWAAAKSGDLRILATLTPGGLAPFGMPEVPTLDKLGADFVPRIMYGYGVRAITPHDRVKQLRAVFKQAVEDQEVQTQMKKIDLTPEWIDPKTYEDTLRKVADDAEKMKEYLKK